MGNTILQRLSVGLAGDHFAGEEEEASEYATLDHIQQKVSGHDRYQLEFKLDYELLAGQQTRYQVLTYIFLPQSLGIDGSTYTQNEFYRDLQNYIRLKTPALTLRDLTRSPASPLAQIQQILDNPAWSTTPKLAEELVNGFKFLRAILKSALRDHFSAQRITGADRLAPALDRDKSRRIPATVAELLTETAHILARYRALAPRLGEPNVDPGVRLAYQLTDESISLLVEERLLKAFRLVEKCQSDPQTVADLKQKLRCAVAQETAQRLRYHADSVLRPDSDNEEFLYRSSVLKKFTSSVLYLSIAVQREGKTLEHILYAVAAGIAMIFATVVAYYAQSVYGVLTLPVFVALVVGYMFKDRIKEVVRVIFANQLRHHLFDRRVTIKTQDNQHRLGYLREKMRFVSEEAVPAAVMAARNRGLIAELANDGQGESVICYTKEVTLFKDIFQKTYGDTPPITGLNDIMRYDVRPYLPKMGDPIQRSLYLDDDQLRTVLCHKVYRVNFVSIYQVTTPIRAATLTRTSVVLNSEGIKRVEPIDLEQSDLGSLLTQQQRSWLRWLT